MIQAEGKHQIICPVISLHRVTYFLGLYILVIVTDIYCNSDWIIY